MLGLFLCLWQVQHSLQVFLSLGNHWLPPSLFPKPFHNFYIDLYGDFTSSLHFPSHSPQGHQDSPLEVTTSPLKWQKHLPKVIVGRCSQSCHHLIVGLVFSQPTTCAITCAIVWNYTSYLFFLWGNKGRQIFHLWPASIHNEKIEQFF